VSLNEPDQTVSTRVLVEVDLGCNVPEQMRVDPEAALLGDTFDDLTPQRLDTLRSSGSPREQRR
jgi:hypothetical protein